MDELKPCPFCGKQAIEDDNPQAFFSGVFDVACSYCGASGPDCYVDDEVEQEDAPDLAVQSWNTRPAEDALRAELEQVKAKRDALESKLAGHTAALCAAGKEIREWKNKANRHQRERDSITKMFDERSDQAQEWRKRAEDAEQRLNEVSGELMKASENIEKIAAINRELKERAEKAEAERDILAERMANEFHQRFGGAEDECYPDYYRKWAAREAAKRGEEA